MLGMADGMLVLQMKEMVEGRGKLQRRPRDECLYREHWEGLDQNTRAQYRGWDQRDAHGKMRQGDEWDARDVRQMAEMIFVANWMIIDKAPKYNKDGNSFSLIRYSL